MKRNGCLHESHVRAEMASVHGKPFQKGFAHFSGKHFKLSEIELFNILR